MKVKNIFLLLCLLLIATGFKAQGLPRGNASEKLNKAFEAMLQANKQEIHSIMILQHGIVLKEQWMGEGAPDKPHFLMSVSKTFTSTAVGFAVSEGKLKLTDKVISFFPEETPTNPSENLKAMTVRDLLTMNCGHATDPTGSARNDKEKVNWVKAFLQYPVTYQPGTYYCYNSLGTYMLSAIVQKVTGMKIVDYLYPRFFEPLGIDRPTWDESPQGINCGGWGLYLKTEDLAKMGQFLLQKGSWNGRQLLPVEWVYEASKAQVPSVPSGIKPTEAEAKGLTKENSDWVQGYGYQMWRCRHNAFRADGAYGQYIIVIPDKNAVVAMTANLQDMQAEQNLIWDYILPVLE